MRGLVLKDILVLRKGLRTYAIFLLFYLILSLIGAFHLSMCVAMGQVILMMLPISAFSYDEMAKWNLYAAALPGGRRALVKGRYHFTLLISILVSVYNLFLSVLFSILGKASMEECLLTVLVSLLLGLVMVSFMIPINFKLGPERARPYLYLVLGIPCLLVFLLYKIGGSRLSQIPEPTSAQLIAIACVFLAVAFCGLYLSYFISCRIMEHKEF